MNPQEGESNKYSRVRNRNTVQRLQKTPRIMANSNPVIDWTEDAELHKRYVEWREEVELELGSSLSAKTNFVKSNYLLRWAGKPSRDYLKSLPESEFKYEGPSAEAILTALEKKTKPKSNEIAAFTKLCSLRGYSSIRVHLRGKETGRAVQLPK